MPTLNLPLSAAVALLPLLFGMIWYNPRVLGKTWMRAAGLSQEEAKKINVPLVLGLTYLFSFFLAVALHFWSIHQFALSALLQPARNYTDPAGFKEAVMTVADMSKDKFRSWSHGLAHGLLFSLVVVLPLNAINSMFERRGWKYILIHTGYWAVSITVMSMFICQFA